jgi:hypothetical protein
MQSRHRWLDFGESSSFYLLSGDQSRESSGFKWQQRVELRELGLALILLCSMLVGLLGDLASVGGVKRVSSKLAGLPF